MKQLVAGALCLLSFSMGFCQASYSYGNEWISAGTVGIARIGVSSAGVYRITLSDFAIQGIDLSVVPPAELHLYRRGEEVPIRVEETSGVATAIEFFGEPNDGADEALACRRSITGFVVEPQLHFNPRRSIQTDVATYFLVRQATPALRIAEHADTAYASLTPLPSLRTEVTEDYLSTEWMPGTQNMTYGSGEYGSPDLGMGEGPKGEPFFSTTPAFKSISTPLAFGGGDSSLVTVRIFSVRSIGHSLQVHVNGTIELDTSFGAYLLKDFRFASNTALPSTTVVSCSVPSVSSGDGLHTLQSVSVRYNHLPDLGGSSQFPVVDFDESIDTYWHLSNAGGSSSAWVWDITTGVRSTGTLSSGNLKVIVPGAPLTRRLWLVTDGALVSPISLSAWTVPGISSSAGARMAVIAPSSMESSAAAYQSYRMSTSPHPQSTILIRLQDLYDEFGYGDISPLAIKRFSHYAATHWTTPLQYLLLWGAGTESARGVTPQLVPAYSYPASDKEYVSNFRLDTLSTYCWAAVGRIPALNDAQANQFLLKLIQYETSPCHVPFEGVFLGGGNSSTGTTFDVVTETLADSFAASPFLGIPYRYVNDPVSGGVTTTATFDSDSAISRGPVVMEIIGLSDGETYDIDFGEPDDHHNVGLHPVVLDLGANGIAFNTDSLRKSQRWLLHPDRGSIAFMGHAGPSIYMGPSFSYAGNLNHRLFRTHMNKPLGDALRAADSSSSGLLQIRLFNLLGDPAMIMCNPVLAGVTEWELPELFIYPNPASASVALVMQSLPAGEMTLSLTSITGAVVKVEKFRYAGGAAEVQVQLAGVANGVYLVQVTRNGSLVTRGKLVVQH